VLASGSSSKAAWAVALFVSHVHQKLTTLMLEPRGMEMNEKGELIAWQVVMKRAKA
jgi:hypothetical protein